MKRQDDSLHLISVGTEVFRDDPRLRVVFIKPVDWQLYIQPVNASDQGYYECQVSSHPPIVHSVFLHVVERTIIERDLPMETTEYSEPTTVSNCCENNEVYEESSTTFQPSTEWPDPDPIESKEEHNVPELEIADERDIPIKNKFYNSGSTIELKCKIVKVPHPTQFIIWKHNSTVLNYDTTRGGISVKTDILPDGAKSQLFIANVGPTDSGNYSCSLGEEAVTSVAVVVITGETPAAMQHGSAAMSANFTVLTLLSIFLSALS